MPAWSKKSYLLVLILALSLHLFGCESKRLNILMPTGSPQYAAAYLQQSEQYNVTIVSGAEALTAGFNDIGYDIIIAPVNMGAKLYAAKPNYQLSGVITWGNYYLISASEIDLSVVDRLDITAFAENQIPDFMLKYILNHHDIEANITYLDSVASITSAYLLDSSKIYLIAEPSMSILQTKKTLQFVDLQNEYQNITGETGFPQAGVFVHKNMATRDLNLFHSRLIQSIYKLKHNDDALTVLKSVGIELPEAAFSKAIERSNIDFLVSADAKDALITFYQLIYDFNPNFIGQIPNDDFYR